MAALPWLRQTEAALSQNDPRLPPHHRSSLKLPSLPERERESESERWRRKEVERRGGGVADRTQEPTWLPKRTRPPDSQA